MTDCEPHVPLETFRQITVAYCGRLRKKAAYVYARGAVGLAYVRGMPIDRVVVPERVLWLLVRPIIL